MASLHAAPGTGTAAAAADGQPDPMQVIASAVGRRGYLTTEWWTTVLAAVLSAVLGLVGLHGPAAAQAAAILAPVLVAAVYAFVRTQHKSALARLAALAVPQAQQRGPGPASPGADPIAVPGFPAE